MKYENNNKCCNSDNLVYDEEIICGEVELWYCIKCKKSYNIPIEIRRDFDNREFVPSVEIKKADCSI